MKKHMTYGLISIICMICMSYKYNLLSVDSKSNSALEKNDQSFPDVQKIHDGLYVSKISDDFYLAIELIDLNNITMWIEYSNLQVTAGSRMNLKYLQSTDGSEHFRLVLNEYASKKISPHNQLWIAYASNEPVTHKTHLNLYGENPTNPSIEMFVTVITSSNALITSHMGISRSWENAFDLQQNHPLRKKHPNQSIYLHSFAAKVMKLQDPRKVYMLTAPAVAMRNLLLKKLPPDSIFTGDNLYEKKLVAAEKDPLTLASDEWTLRARAHETAEKREQRLNRSAQESYEFLQIGEKFSLLKTNPPRIIRSEEGLKFSILKPDGSPLVSFDTSTPIYQWIFTFPYLDKGLTLPYTLIDLDVLAGFKG